MSNTVSVTDFRNNIGTYIDKIIYNNESYFLKKGKNIVARITAAKSKEAVVSDKKSPLFKLAGLWKDIDMDKYKKALDEVVRADTNKPIIYT